VLGFVYICKSGEQEESERKEASERGRDFENNNDSCVPIKQDE